MYVYAEEILMLNFTMDMLIFLIAGKNEKIKHKKLIYVVISLIESVIMLLLIKNKSIKNLLLLKIFMPLFTAIAIFRPLSLKKIISNTILLIMYSGIFAGAILLVCGLFADISLTIYFLKPSYLTFTFGAALGAVFCELFERLIFSKINFFNHTLHNCSFSCMGHYVKDLTLFADTGNFLSTFNGNPVILIDQKILMRLCGLDKFSFFSYSEYYNYYDTLTEEIKKRIGVIRAKGVNKTEYLLIVKTDNAQLGSLTLFGAVIAAGSFEKSFGFDGIFNPLIIERK